jgi:hypothetical protein
MLSAKAKKLALESFLEKKKQLLADQKAEHVALKVVLIQKKPAAADKGSCPQNAIFSNGP